MWEDILDQIAGQDQETRDKVWAEWNKGTQMENHKIQLISPI